MRKKWSVLKTKVNPGSLHGHSASKVMGSMIIFGGKKSGQISNDLWKFYFGNIFVLHLEFTKKIVTKKKK